MSSLPGEPKLLKIDAQVGVKGASEERKMKIENKKKDAAFQP